MLPDGQIGEARLLHGDGIFSADPIRVIIVDAKGRLLARSHRSATMALSCSRELHCRAFDVGDGKILEIDPKTFREGPVVPRSGYELGTIEAGDETWGFRVRPASLLEYAEAELTLAQRSTADLVALFIAGSLMAFAGLVIFRRDRPEIEILDGMIFLKILSSLMLLAMVAFFAMLAASGISATLALGSLGAGIAFVLLLRHLRRRMQVTPPSPSPAA